MPKLGPSVDAGKGAIASKPKDDYYGQLDKAKKAARSALATEATAADLPQNLRDLRPNKALTLGANDQKVGFQLGEAQWDVQPGDTIGETGITFGHFDPKTKRAQVFHGDKAIWLDSMGYDKTGQGLRQPAQDWSKVEEFFGDPEKSTPRRGVSPATGATLEPEPAPEGEEPEEWSPSFISNGPERVEEIAAGQEWDPATKDAVHGIYGGAEEELGEPVEIIDVAAELEGNPPVPYEIIVQGESGTQYSYEASSGTWTTLDPDASTPIR